MQYQEIPCTAITLQNNDFLNNKNCQKLIWINWIRSGLGRKILKELLFSTCSEKWKMSLGKATGFNIQVIALVWSLGPDVRQSVRERACWSHLVAKFATNLSGAMLLLNLIQVTESISGSDVPLAMFLKHLRCWSRWEKWRASSRVRPVSRDFPLSRFQRRKNLPQPSFSGELSFLEMRHKCYRWLWFSKVFIVVTPNAAQLRE